VVREEANKLLFMPYAEFFLKSLTKCQNDIVETQEPLWQELAIFETPCIDVHTRRHAVKPYREC